MSFLRRNPILILVLSLTVALFQDVFFVKALKYDNASIGFIFSNYISQCVQSNIFPYWNPYLHFGSPFYGDLVSRFHYPVVWAFAYTTGYSFFSLHIEFFLMYLGTGLGFYKLLSLFNSDVFINLSFSILLALSGFMLGHAQHLTILASFCFFIWSLYFLIQVIKFRKYLYSIPLGITLSFSLTGGYPAMCFIQFYIYLFSSVYLIVQFKSFKSILYLLLSSVIFLTLSSGYLYSLYVTFEWITRTDGVTLAMANSHPFSPHSFISFLNPGFIISNSELFQTDLSMRDSYIGVFLFPFVFYSIRYIGDKKIWIALALALIFLGFSLGDYTPMRTFLYHYVPFMNYFNYSSIFRFFPVLVLVLVCWLSYYHIVRNNGWISFENILTIFIPIYLFIIGIALLYFSMYTSNLHRFLEFTSVLTIFPLVSLLIAKYSLKRFSNVDHKKLALCFCLVLDIIGTSQVMSPLLVYNRKESVFTFHKYYQRYNRDFNFVPEKEFLFYSHYSNTELDNFLENGNLITKTPAADGYDNYKLRKYYDIVQMPNITKHKYIYTTDTLSKVELTAFSPNQMKAKIIALKSDTCILLQNKFQGWTAKLNGVKTNLLFDEYFPKVKVLRGINEVEFNYELPIVKLLHYFQLASLIVLIFLFFLLRYRSNFLNKVLN